MKSALSLIVLALTPAVFASSGAHGSRLTRKHLARAAKAEVDHDLVAKRSNIEVRDDHNNTLTKRAFSGRGTFYYTDVGLGACGQLSQNDEFTVALNTAQYGGGYPGPECFKYITISANGKTQGGIQIRDQCPTCGYGDLDLSPGLFRQFADEGAGVISISWWFDGQETPAPSPSPSPEPAPTSTWTPPPPSTTSTSQWVPPTTSSSVWVEPSPSSTWSPPASSSTSTWTPPPSSSSSAAASSSVYSSSSSSSSSSIVISSSAINSTNPYAIVSSVEGSASASASASASSSGASGSVGTEGGNQAPMIINSNLEAINGLVTNYGQIMVVAGGAGPA